MTGVGWRPATLFARGSTLQLFDDRPRSLCAERLPLTSNACDAHILAVDTSLVHVSVAHRDRLCVSPWRAHERAQYILYGTMYFYILSEPTCDFLWVASYDASSAAIATKSIIRVLCEIGFFANCVFSGVRTPLFLASKNPRQNCAAGSSMDKGQWVTTPSNR